MYNICSVKTWRKLSLPSINISIVISIVTLSYQTLVYCLKVFSLLFESL